MVGVMGNRSFQADRRDVVPPDGETPGPNEWTYPEAWTALMEVGFIFLA